jgi:condensin complex subunit 2
MGADAAADDFGGDMGGDDNGDGNDNGSPVGEAEQRAEGRPVEFVPFDPRRLPTERDLIMAMTDGDGDGGAMDYFDQNFLKNWAGPEHWKLRKVAQKRELMSICTPLNPLTHD